MKKETLQKAKDIERNSENNEKNIITLKTFKANEIIIKNSGGNNYIHPRLHICNQILNLIDEDLKYQKETLKKEFEELKD